MKIINLTPHNINFILKDKTIILSPETTPLRLVEETKVIGKINDIPITKTTYNLVSTPKKQKDTIYIVSKIILEAYPEREDFYMINESIKDETGRIIGCKSLTRL